MLSDPEKEAVRRHLGYIGASLFDGLALGVPAPMQTLYVLENTLNRLLPDAQTAVRRMLAELDCIEDQMSKFRGTYDVKQLSGTTFRDDPMSGMRREYSHWAHKLADLCGTIVNPYSSAHRDCDGTTVIINPC